jgi:uncharacterized protein
MTRRTGNKQLQSRMDGLAKKLKGSEVTGKARFDGENLFIGDQKIPMRSISRDGWMNILTGMGVGGKDKRKSGEIRYDLFLTERQLEEIYASDYLARRIAGLLPFEATREWIEFNEEQETETNDEMDRLKIRDTVAKAWRYGRFYGGGGILLNTVDAGKDWSQPLDLNNVRQLKSLVVLNRFELQVTSTDVESDLASENFNYPKMYRYVPRTRGGQQVLIHHSRLIRFDGVELPELLRASNQYWGDSVFTSIYDALRDYGLSHAAVANLIQEFRMLAYKVKNLAQQLAAGHETDVQRRMEMMNLSRSILGAFMLDADAESMDGFSATVAGLKELLDGIKSWLQSMTDIPHTILFNESPSGTLGATGRSEERMWYDYVKSQQESYLSPKLDKILKVMFMAKDGPTGGKEPDGWSYTYKRLWQLTEKEQAETDKLNMETDKGYMESGVLQADEVRTDRFPEKEQL